MIINITNLLNKKIKNRLKYGRLLFIPDNIIVYELKINDDLINIHFNHHYDKDTDFQIIAHIVLYINNKFDCEPDMLFVYNNLIGIKKYNNTVYSCHDAIKYYYNKFENKNMAIYFLSDFVMIIKLLKNENLY